MNITSCRKKRRIKELRKVGGALHHPHNKPERIKMCVKLQPQRISPVIAQTDDKKEVKEGAGWGGKVGSGRRWRQQSCTHAAPELQTQNRNEESENQTQSSSPDPTRRTGVRKGQRGMGGEVAAQQEVSRQMKRSDTKPAGQQKQQPHQLQQLTRTRLCLWEILSK